MRQVELSDSLGNRRVRGRTFPLVEGVGRSAYPWLPWCVLLSCTAWWAVQVPELTILI